MGMGSAIGVAIEDGDSHDCGRGEGWTGTVEVREEGGLKRRDVMLGEDDRVAQRETQVQAKRAGRAR